MLRRISLSKIALISLLSTSVFAIIKKCTAITGYEVIEEIPFDKMSFTQGFTYGNGKLYVSTGLYGRSSVREISKTDGRSILDSIPLSDKYFGEGLAFYKNKLIQITWKENTGFIYQTVPNLKLIKTFTFTTTKDEGWGITYDPINSQFIVSDGSQYLHFWDENTLQETHKIAVTDYKGSAVGNINELEYYDQDHVLANIWFEDKICLINTKTGDVEHEIDFSDLWPMSERRNEDADVLNGISVFEDDTFLVTGKLWSKMYVIRFV